MCLQPQLAHARTHLCLKCTSLAAPLAGSTPKSGPTHQVYCTSSLLQPIRYTVQSTHSCSVSDTFVAHMLLKPAAASYMPQHGEDGRALCRAP